MSILDGTHVQPFDRGSIVVRDLTAAKRAELVVEARAAALDAACRLVADGHTKWAVRAPLELAEQFEAWLLRDEDGPQAPADGS